LPVRNSKAVCSGRMPTHRRDLQITKYLFPQTLRQRNTNQQSTADRHPHPVSE